MEQWRDVSGYEGLYQVSSLGRIKRVGKSKGAHRGRILKPQNNGGYLRVRLYKGRRSTWKTMPVHQAVCEAFHGTRPDNHEVNHKNGKPSDNRPENLEWMTRSENLSHSIHSLGRFVPHGEESVRAKLTNTEVTEMRSLYASKTLNQVALAKRYRVTQTTVWRILQRLTWKHI